MGLPPTSPYYRPGEESPGLSCKRRANRDPVTTIGIGNSRGFESVRGQSDVSSQNRHCQVSYGQNKNCPQEIHASAGSVAAYRLVMVGVSLESPIAPESHTYIHECLDGDSLFRLPGNAQ